MGLLDRIFGRTSSPAGPDRGDASTGWPVGQHTSAAGQDPDEIAIQRYRYMLRTAPPETVEQAHAEAFEKLTPEQRRRVLDEVGHTVPESERATSDDPRSLARMATRAEMRQPGTMERVLGGGGRSGGMGMGGVIAGSLLASVAGAFIGTSIASAFLDDGMGSADTASGEDTSGAEPAVQDIDDPGFSDPGMNDFGGDFGV
ncbi:MAG TPA: hypothetical protein VJT72_23120 [Pseudonocardiaceae bacterium]|nr:hypothetical protein [Pseudonocardiaceae bacterium]